MKREVFLLALTLFLSACGGGGDSATSGSADTGASGDSSSDTGDSGDTTTTGKPLILDTLIQGACYNRTAFSGATVVAQDSTGAVIEQYQTDSDGHLDVTVPDETSSVSVVMSTESDGNTSLNIKTYLDFPGGDLGNFIVSEYDPGADCGCSSYGFDIQSLLTNDAGATLKLGATAIALVSGQSSTVTVEHCADEGDDFDMQLIAADGTSAKAAVIDISKVNSVTTLTDSSFDATGLAVDIDNSDENVTYEAKAWLSDGWQLRNSGANTPLFIYPDAADNSAVLAYYDWNGSLNNYQYQGEVGYKDNVENDDPTVSSTLPGTDNQALLDTASAFIDALDNGRINNSSYDLSDVDMRMNNMSIFMVGMATNVSVSWDIEGPVSGTIPTLQFPDDIESQLSTVNYKGYEFELTLFGFDESLSWADYLSERIEQTRTPSLIATDSRFAHYRFMGLYGTPQ
ncbi:hypothetical protein [Gallaecimonas mangrovi]|uniref:hypothetical protein n=1 Tax=Gallaecimonas mangrovi TaxID=2291597 RepID=UPI000E2039EF|nr:hypothetical protein [Gallaecimonas mangrovi]